ncbi:MAG TPA: VanW family protein [Caulobacteraceae bacterium]|nr:VanW family protein [Caulobacteraceae bacterium]
MPTRISSLVFAGKAAAFRARRGVLDLAAGPRRLKAVPAAGFSEIIADCSTPLWSDAAPGEHGLQLGKVQNLRIACRALDGVLIPAGAVLSFWRQVGPPDAGRGYVRGRMLKQGCIMPVVGGGLCQLSNALYEAALQAGCRIVERHPHSRIVPGSAATLGRDATVAWNYVDLRFSGARDLRLTARLDRDSLTVRLSARPGGPAAPDLPVDAAFAAPGPAARSCAACGETDCFRHAAPAAAGSADRRAFLVDEGWPEFQAYVRSARGPEDLLGRPLGEASARYGWSGEGFARSFSAGFETARRSLALRGAANGAARRRAELDAARRIAAALARRLTPEVTAVTVAQSYLPFLWRDGHLGGREVTVLMTRLPASVLQRRLDAAFARHPDRPTLADFRAEAALIEAEDTALAQASRIVTAHAEVAALFAGRALQLPWRTAAATSFAPRPIRKVAFPGPTVARKGAFEVRAAALALDLEVAPMGAELEGAGFWDGVRAGAFTGWADIDAVVQPALTEEQPRKLLAALDAGVPVFATAACGLASRPGLTLIEPDAPEALIAALLSWARGHAG